MKKLLLLLILFASCKKSTTPTTTIKVLETATNLPVSSARVVLFRCNYGCPLGATILYDGTTDASGACQVPGESYNDATSEMNVVKTRYWPFNTQKATVVYLTPEGWLQLHIHKTGSYPAGSTLNLALWSLAGKLVDIAHYNAAMDSILMVRAWGAQQNRIEWQVVDPSYNLIGNGTIDALPIPKFDTLKNITLNY